jgi:cellobiose-specific phosphotransferase system component IIA
MGGKKDGTAEAQAQLSHSRAVAWALCLQSDSGTHFTTPMHYVHAQQTLMYTAMEFSGAKALKRERVKAILVSQQGGFY